MPLTTFLVIAIVVLLGVIVYLLARKPHCKNLSKVGRYSIIRELPSGGMCRIFVGERPDKKHVIIKIPVESRPQKENITKFLEEGAILSRLKHPHIVGIEEYGKVTIDNFPTGFIALEYVEGHSLDKLIKAGKKFSMQDASLIISSVADALGLCHKSGIYHRDISPNNILVNYKDNKIKIVKLIDFGIAKWHKEAKYTTKDMMKEQYASPEQINFEPLDGRSDIYSLGIVYYELITGRRPYATWDRKVVPPSPSELGLEIPEGINNLILKMLAFSKEDRIQSMDEVVQAIGVVPIGGPFYSSMSGSFQSG